MSFSNYMQNKNIENDWKDDRQLRRPRLLPHYVIKGFIFSGYTNIIIMEYRITVLTYL